MGALTRGLRAIGNKRGFTMMEVIVVLAVIGVMAAVLTPMVMNYVEDAKVSRAQSDVKTIAGVILNLTRDVAHFPLYKDGTKTTGTPEIELLRGPGNDPVDSDDANKKWLTTAADKTGELENHLIKNAPGGNKYPTTGRFSWKGPYVEKITEDAWGNRYLVNIKNANPADGTPKVVWVISAGPNGKFETDPNSAADSGPNAGGDDIAIRIK